MRILRNRAFSKDSRGFALIAVLLLILIVSALAVSVAYLTMREKKGSGSERDNNVAYYGAEGGLEKISSDLTYLYQQKLSPTAQDLIDLSANVPTLPGITFTEYKVAPLNGSMTAIPSNILTGDYAGLNALMVKLTSTVTAQAPGSSQVRMVRNLEVALIPVFQFGMFSDTDVTFHNGPDMDFYGRIHTNGSLYLTPGNGGSATFHDKLSAAKDVIRQSLPTGGSSAGYQGGIAIPTGPTQSGCPSLYAQNGNPSIASCRILAVSEGSAATAGGTVISGWQALSYGKTYLGDPKPNDHYNSMVISNAKQLKLPFVKGNALPIEIIRQPPQGESPTSDVGLSRYFNEAQIRVLLDDRVVLADGTSAFPAACKIAEADGTLGLVELDSTPAAVLGLAGVKVYAGNNPIAAYSFAKGDKGQDNNWKLPAGHDTSLLGTVTPAGFKPTFLCVLGKNAAGNFFPVTNEWLRQGFEKRIVPPIPDLAILHLQKQVAVGNPGYQSWPINMYDTREGEYRIPANGVAGTCAINGIMNLVELDVGNLTKWLATTLPLHGTAVDNVRQNGYILYFSDRRGMLPNPRATPPNTKNGISGLEDVINVPLAGNAAGNGKLDGATGNTLPNSQSVQFAEDVDQNGFLDNFGEVYIGLGFGFPAGSPPGMTRINTGNLARNVAIAQQNIVAGPRHALRLVNGNSGKLPSLAVGVGGFTVASEQPVYILGDYNANNTDGLVSHEVWTSVHVAASVVADAVTLLSNGWIANGDFNSFFSSTTSIRNNINGVLYPGRVATETWVRAAVAAGKNQAFTDGGATLNFGGDGGGHNFLRYLEDWGSPGGGLPAVANHYRGSLVSFFFSQYATGTYKSNPAVYNPPTRSYSFDTDFQNIANMPPGTPMFRDVENVGGHQDFSSQ